MFLRFLILLLFPISLFAQKKNSSSLRLKAGNIKEIIDAMSLEQKANLVVGPGMPSEEDGPVIGHTNGKVPGAAGGTTAFLKLGIPAMVLADGPAGVRISPIRIGEKSKTFHATAWPVGTLLASSWDTVLVNRVGKFFGKEVKEYGVDIILAPGVNIQRNPLNGRNFEYYSEDPLVSGLIASAMINGLQSNGIGASIKHFAANNQETKRGTMNSVVSERALREIYLKSFEIAIKKSQPWTVMSAYNKINGTYTSESSDLLTKILREDWGFKGLVMTDWFGGRNPIDQMKAGNDLIEPGLENKKEQIISAVKDGSLKIEMLDRNVEKILNIILKTPAFKNYKYSDAPDLKKHAALSRYAATESMILLKNNSALPLKRQQRIALFGNGSFSTIIGGTGSGDVHEVYSVSISEGLKNDYLIDRSISKAYTAHIARDVQEFPKPKLLLGPVRMTPEYAIDQKMIEQSAINNDLAIYTISRNAGEGADRKIEGDFTLSLEEKNTMKIIAENFHAKGKKVIVVLNIGGVIETASWKDIPDAILLAWQPGQEAGNAIADILSGKANPSGKLTASFPINYEDGYSSRNFPPNLKDANETIYEEGIYVGYRYYDTFGVRTSYPFGFGLSYTKFSYSDLTLSTTVFQNELIAKVKITNTGKVSGKEVVQLYLTSPEKNMEKPAKELKGFAKTALLKPGESQTLYFSLKAEQLASFDSVKSSWVADSGNYKLFIASSLEDLKATANFSLGKDILVEKVNRALSPKVPIIELSKNYPR